MTSFWSDKRVTVTGGAGFLGKHLVARLERYGARVFVPRRRQYNLVALDACLHCLLEQPCDILFHAAA
jgi:GDP-L-fucose synthase